MSKPTIVLVPGAWHKPSHYQPLLDWLESHGYPTASKQLPSVGATEPENKDVACDTAFVRDEVLVPQLEQGKDVVLLMHSYGGCPGGAAATGLSKTERLANGQKGGVIGLVYMCAFVAGEGDSLISKLPGQTLPDWVLINEQTKQLSVDKPEAIFYNMVDEQATTQAIQTIEKHAHLSFLTPSAPSAWAEKSFDGRRAYIKCHLDNAIHIVGQNAMTTHSGVDWLELQLEDAGHSPFLSHVESVGKYVDSLAQKWGI